MENHTPDAARPGRRTDRRLSTGITSPPYDTRDGMVLSDRRSPIDRRATWIREFSLEAVANPGDPTTNLED